MKKIICIIATILLHLTVYAQEANYAVNTTKSSIIWKAKKVVGGYEGTILIRDGNLLVSNGTISGGKFVIDTKSIASEEASTRAIDHLKNEDFFYVSKYPTATFVLTGVKKQNGKTVVSGNLTIKDITKPITFPADITYGKNTITALANDIKIDRTQFGIEYRSGSIFSGLGNKAIEDIFTLDISLTAEKK